MNRRILLIGGNQGIGHALSHHLLAHGDTPIAASRSRKELDPAIEHHTIDIVDPASTLPTLSDPIDGLVYLPGSINLKPFSQMKLDTFRQDMEINYFGAIRSIQHFLPQLSEGASIVLMSSVAASIGLNFHSSISGAKGAIEGLTLALSAELAPKIRVNAVAPSITRTPLSEKLLDTPAKTTHASDKHPLKKVGKAEDIAQAIAFLLSKESEWITGQILHVDGGLSSIKNL